LANKAAEQAADESPDSAANKAANEALDQAANDAANQASNREGCGADGQAADDATAGVGGSYHGLCAPECSQAIHIARVVASWMQKHHTRNSMPSLDCGIEQHWAEETRTGYPFRGCPLHPAMTDCPGWRARALLSFFNRSIAVSGTRLLCGFLLVVSESTRQLLPWRTPRAWQPSPTSSGRRGLLIDACVSM
jgi:hypothetical protein